MNLRDLKYLVTVAEYKHFGKAAQACFVSQPTLSAQLKKLEEELGVILFDRNNKQVLITPIGEAIVEQAHNVLREAQQLRVIAKHASDPCAGLLRLGIIPTLGPYLLPHIIPAIKKTLPKLELYLYEDKTDVILAQLNKGKLDAIILALPVPLAGCEAANLFTEPFYIALPPGHPLAKKTTLSITDLNDQNMLLLQDGHCLRDQALEVCARVSIKEKSSFQATSLETLRNMVSAGSGITLLPELATKLRPKTQRLTVIKPFQKPAPARDIALLWRKHSAYELCCQELTKIIRSQIQQII